MTEPTLKSNPRGGRPPKADSESRCETLRFRATIAERSIIEGHARAAGLSVSDYMRELALKRPIKARTNVRDSLDTISTLNRLVVTIRGLTGQLAPLSNNINQIAKYMHTGRSVDHWIEEEKAQLEAVQSQIKDVMNTAQSALKDAL